MAKAVVVAVGAEAVVAFLLLRTWGFLQALVVVTLRAGGFFLRAGGAPGVVVRRGWGFPKVPLGDAAGRRPGWTWLLGPGFAMASAQAVDFAGLVWESWGFPGPGFAWLGAVGPRLAAELPLWLPVAAVPGIPPAAAAFLLVFGALLPIAPRYLESSLNVDFLLHLLLLEMISSR